MFALSDAREFSFSQVPYFEGEKKDNWPIKLLKRRDVILLQVLGREPEGAQATTMATAIT